METANRNTTIKLAMSSLLSTSRDQIIISLMKTKCPNIENISFITAYVDKDPCYICSVPTVDILGWMYEKCINDVWDSTSLHIVSAVVKYFTILKIEDIDDESDVQPYDVILQYRAKWLMKLTKIMLSKNEEYGNRSNDLRVFKDLGNAVSIFQILKSMELDFGSNVIYILRELDRKQKMVFSIIGKNYIEFINHISRSKCYYDESGNMMLPFTVDGVFHLLDDLKYKPYTAFDIIFINGIVRYLEYKKRYCEIDENSDIESMYTQVSTSMKYSQIHYDNTVKRIVRDSLAGVSDDVIAKKYIPRKNDTFQSIMSGNSYVLDLINYIKSNTKYDHIRSYIRTTDLPLLSDRYRTLNVLPRKNPFSIGNIVMLSINEIMENAKCEISISPISDDIFIRGIKKAEAITISNMQR